jgi:ketosteroid isomerase-like protein
MKKHFVAGLLCIMVFIVPLKAQKHTAQSEILAIKNRLNEWVEFLNNHNLKKLQTIYTNDYSASYPNQPDQNYELTLNSYERLFQNDFIEIKISIKVLEVEASGNLAYVRLNQTAEVKPKNESKAEYGQDTGIQIWKEQKDGS